MKIDEGLLLFLIQDGILARSTRYGRFDVFRVLLDDYMTIWLGANCQMQEKSVTSRPAIPDKTACFDLHVTEGDDSFYALVEVNGRSNYEDHLRLLFEAEGQHIRSKLKELIKARELVTQPVTPSCSIVEGNVCDKSNVAELWSSIESELGSFVSSLLPIYPTMFGRNEDADMMNFFVVEPVCDDVVAISRSGRHSASYHSAPDEVKRARQDGRVRWAKDKKAIAVPVHVAGSPWIIIHFTLANEKDNRFEAYRYYRELVPDVAEGFRRWARQQFRLRCADAIRETVLQVNVMDASARHAALKQGLAGRFSPVERCLRGPRLALVDADKPTSVVARLMGEGSACVFVEILPLSSQDEADSINLFDVESPCRLKLHLEQTVSAVTAEFSSRSWEEAAISAHILGTHISDIRTLVLYQSTKVEQEVERHARQMEHYLNATRTMFRGDAKVDEIRLLETLLVDVPSIPPNSPILWGEEVTPKVLVRRSKDFLLIAFETCASNTHKHGAGAMELKIERTGSLVCASVLNVLTESDANSLTAELPSLNAGSSGNLGIHTLHLACDTWFKVRPVFAVAQRGTEKLFSVSFPIAIL